MKRHLVKDLLHWKERTNRMPLLLRGARQVGKTYLVEQFAQAHFRSILTVNFELNPELISCFEQLDPHKIISNLGMLLQKHIEPGEDLLFLDEIQDCPNAIRALRYFKEKLPELHVIGAGSLLELTLNDANFRMPVGRVESLYLKPLSFMEFLTASGFTELSDYLAQVTLETAIPPAIHQKLLELVKLYSTLGGMPAVLHAYFTTQQIAECQILQTALLNTYRQDFGKYAGRTDHKYLQRLFEKIPGLVADHFKYAKVDPDMRSRDLKSALDMLRHAGLVYPVYATAASSLPLSSLINEKQFKLLFLDIGLMLRAAKLDAELLLSDDLLLANRGKLAEQFVGQELLAYADPLDEAAVHFWCRQKPSSTAEVDYVVQAGSRIVPIEVKAGTTGQLRSLKLLMQERNLPLGIRISQLPLKLEDNILSLPIYLVNQLNRLVKLF